MYGLLPLVSMPRVGRCSYGNHEHSRDEFAGRADDRVRVSERLMFAKSKPQAIVPTGPIHQRMLAPRRPGIRLQVSGHR